MKAINVPTRQPVPFATSGTKNTIPATQPAGSPGRASYSGGFPSETMQPIASGGTPPFGQDFNGLFFDVTSELRWAQAGGTYTYDSTFSTSIGGYPAGAVLKSTLASALWISTVDDNTADPDGGAAAGWVAFRPNSGRVNLTVASGDLTPTAAQLLNQVVSITGNAAGLTTTLRLPLVAGASYLVNNATTGAGSTLNVQGATGTGVAVAQGQATVVFCDGTNYYSAGSSGAGQYLPIDGTAVAATKLATARAFNLAGPVTATGVNFDGTGNVTLNTAIADGALTIAKTSGLQTALDAKANLSGAVFTGNISAANMTAGSFLSPSTAWIASPSGAGSMYMRPNGSGSAVGQAVFNSAGELSLGTSGSQHALLIVDTGGNGANIGLAGNGSTTPNKTIRAQGGQLQFINSAYTTIVSYMTDTGSWAVAGTDYGSSAVATPSDLSRHISLYGGQMGFSITGSRLNYVIGAGNAHVFVIGGVDQLNVSSGTLVAAGTVRGGSDARVKSNIRPITNALAIVRRALVGVVYNRTDQDNAVEAGFVADRVQAHLPHLVGECEMNGFKDFKSMDYMHASAYLAAAITELEDKMAARDRWMAIIGPVLFAIGFVMALVH